MAIDPLAIAPGRGEGMAAILPDSTNLLPMALQDVKTREAAAAKAQQDATKSLAKLENKHIWDRDQEKFNTMLQETWDYALGGDPNDRAFQAELAKRKQQLIEYADRSNLNMTLYNQAMMKKDWSKAYNDQRALAEQIKTTPGMDFDPYILEEKTDIPKWIEETKKGNIDEAIKKKQEYFSTGKIAGSQDDYVIGGERWSVSPAKAERQVQQMLYDPTFRKTAEEMMMNEDPKGQKYANVFEFGKNYLAPQLVDQFSGQRSATRIPDGTGSGRKLYAVDDIGNDKQIKRMMTPVSTPGQTTPAKAREATTTLYAPLTIEPTNVDLSITPNTIDYTTGLAISDQGIKKAQAGEVGIFPVIKNTHFPVPDDWKTRDEYKNKEITYEPVVGLVYDVVDNYGVKTGSKSVTVPLSEIKNTPALKGKKIKVGDQTMGISEYYEKLAADKNAAEGIQVQSKPKPATTTGGGAKPTPNVKRDASGNTYGDGSSKDKPAPWPGKENAIKGKWYKNSDGAVGQWTGGNTKPTSSNKPAANTTANATKPAPTTVDSTAIYEQNKKAMQDLFSE